MASIPTDQSIQSYFVNDNMSEPLDRSRYMNPSPPPGYVRPDPHLALKPGLEEIDGEIFRFLALTIESGILEDSNPSSDFTIQTSDEDEVVNIPVPPKVHPLIDLEEVIDTSVPPKVPPLIDLEAEISDGEVPRVPIDPLIPKAGPSKKPDVKNENQQRSTRRITPSSSRVRNHHSRKEKEVDYSSESSNESSSHTRRKKKIENYRRRSRSHSSSEYKEYLDYKERKYNPALVKEEENLFGLFYCPDCKLSMNSESTLQSHLKGKKHMKVVKQKNIVQAMSDLQTTNIVVKPNRYPESRPNIQRIPVSEMALCQRAVQDRVHTPCPGLEKVIEIQGLTETHYYCKLCDAPCSMNTLIPHLGGRKHQLLSLKYLDVETYERLKYNSNKREVDKILLETLRDIERSQGAGLMAVEREIDPTIPTSVGLRKTESAPRSEERSPRREERSSRGAETALRREDIPGPSHRYFDLPDDTRPESFEQTVVPDTSKSDLYCKICDSHMNNNSMWESHIRGKRHLKNVKKAPGEALFKAKSYALPNARALIMDELDKVEEPVVGLTYIREIQNPEMKEANYNCFLCGSSLTHLTVIDHILKQKHRIKFLEKIKHPDMEMMSQIGIQASLRDSIIAETCAQEENENGRGKMEVHIMKNAVAWW